MMIMATADLKAAGKLKKDFTCDDIVLKDDRIAVVTYTAIPRDVL